MSDRIKDRILELKKRLSEKPEQPLKDAYGIMDYYYIQGQIEGLTFALGYEITRTVQETADQLKYKKRQVYYRTTKGDFGDYYYITGKEADDVEVKNTNKGGKLLIPQTGIDNFKKKYEVKVAKAGDSNQKNLYVHRQNKKNLVKVEKEGEA